MPGLPDPREIRTPRQVGERIDALALRVADDYRETSPLVIAIAEGARRFTDLLVAGLGRCGIRPEVAYVRAHRTGSGSELGPVRLEPFDTANLRERHVLVVDDIIDEGRTLEAVLALVRDAKARSVRVAVLVDKRERRRVEVPLDYVGFEVDCGWVVGMGMDMDGAYRELDSLAVIDTQEDSS